ncbi:hypothetical protein SFC43_32795 [Bacteroides sp. CR5/BHMF/2]|nr:hypothetical protein [Bacteroides sp. CR5/BHMF/2]
MSISLIIPMGADKVEYENYMPYIFNFSPDGTSLCIKSIQGLDIKRFDNIYFTILEKYDKIYYLSVLLKLQFKKLGLMNAKVVVLDEPTTSQAETVYQTVNRENIKGAIFVKDADGYFCGDFTIRNSIAIYPLDKLEMVNPRDKSYVGLDDKFYITNIIEKKLSAASLMLVVIFLKMQLFFVSIIKGSVYMNSFLCHISFMQCYLIKYLSDRLR